MARRNLMSKVVLKHHRVGCPWTEWRVGRVLSEFDVTLLAHYYEELSEEIARWPDRVHREREAVLMELGGQEFLEAVQAEDRVKTEAFVDKIFNELNEKRLARVRNVVAQRRAHGR